LFDFFFFKKKRRRYVEHGRQMVQAGGVGGEGEGGGGQIKTKRYKVCTKDLSVLSLLETPALLGAVWGYKGGSKWENLFCAWISDIPSLRQGSVWGCSRKGME